MNVEMRTKRKAIEGTTHKCLLELAEEDKGDKNKNLSNWRQMKR